MKIINTMYLWSHSSIATLCLTVSPWTAAHQASLFFSISWSLLKFMSIELMMPSNHLILCSLSFSPTFSLSQHQGFSVSLPFTSGGQSIGASASVLLMNIHGWFPLGLTGLISLLSKGPSRTFSTTTVQKHQFFGAQPSLWSNSHTHTWLLKKPYLWLYGLWLLHFYTSALYPRLLHF